MNLLANESDTSSSTGRQDSVLIAYNDLRKVNSKLIELEYEKSINERLRVIINNDSIAVNSLRNKLISVHKDYNRDIKKVKRERNIAGGIGFVSIVLLIISIL